MTVVNFDNHFGDCMGEVDKGYIEVFPKLWNLRPYDKTNGEVTRSPRLTAACHKVREETKAWGDYKKLLEEIPEFLLIRRMLLGAVSSVQTSNLRAFETNEIGLRNSRKQRIRVLWSEMPQCCILGSLLTRTEQREDE